MNNKIKYAIIIAIVLTGIFIIPAVTAQNANEYRAFVTNERVSPDLEHGPATVPLVVTVTYVPIYPSPTYTLTYNDFVFQADLSQPQTLDAQVAQAVKNDGLTWGYDVTKVYLPSYSMKVV